MVQPRKVVDIPGELKVAIYVKSPGCCRVDLASKERSIDDLLDRRMHVSFLATSPFDKTGFDWVVMGCRVVH